MSGTSSQLMHNVLRMPKRLPWALPTLVSPGLARTFSMHTHTHRHRNRPPGFGNRPQHSARPFSSFHAASYSGAPEEDVANVQRYFRAHVAQGGAGQLPPVCGPLDLPSSVAARHCSQLAEAQQWISAAGASCRTSERSDSATVRTSLSPPLIATSYIMWAVTVEGRKPADAHMNRPETEKPVNRFTAKGKRQRKS